MFCVATACNKRDCIDVVLARILNIESIVQPEVVIDERVIPRVGINKVKLTWFLYLFIVTNSNLTLKTTTIYSIKISLII